MKFDFSQPAPRAKSLEEAQQIIDALWDDACQSQKTLTSKITNLEEKLNTSSSNSSLPPAIICEFFFDKISAIAIDHYG